MNARINETELSRVREVLAASMGLYFPMDRMDMLSHNLTLAAGEFGFQHINEFIQWLISTNLKKDQIEILASYLTISETFFWREPQVFSALTDFILPDLIASKKNGDRNIRIWSAGCSSGEEAYSLAIALHKAIPDIKDWNILILATDINPKVLNKAVSGIYSRWSFRNCPPWLKTDYFHTIGSDNFEIIPEIKNMVTFANLNLTEDVFPLQFNNTYAMDIIFCRNVLMYFTDEWISKISQNIFHSLTKNGWFVVSSCELSSQVFPHFNSVNFPGAIFYRKSKKGILSSIKVPSIDFIGQVDFPKLADRPVSAETVLHNTNLASDTLFNFSKLTIATEQENATTYIPESEVTSETEPVNITISKIRVLANQGHLPEALSLCNDEIAVDKLSIGLYFLRASILQELDNPIEAIASLKQAIYLDPNFIMGHFALGNLFIKQGKPKNSKRHFNNVLDLLSTLNNEDILSETDGLSVKHLREIILANMQKLKII